MSTNLFKKSYNVIRSTYPNLRIFTISEMPVYRICASTCSGTYIIGDLEVLGLMQRTKWGLAACSLLTRSAKEFCEQN